MGYVLDFRMAPKRPQRKAAGGQGPVSQEDVVVLFPGARIEREALDLAARIGTIGTTAGQAAPEAE
ncbi:MULTISPECIES: hypothetical protein [unclassified Pannonibacter]|uniref:hypothetical protein n=1 Tax=unclassified Pannonibacter TaxID=2627228 RepID=UPI0016464BF1|nr:MULTISPECIES: hypothetical protein [unclassified Pannonibacter]